MTPEYEPPPFSAQGVVALIEEILAKFPRTCSLDSPGTSCETRSAQNLFDIDVWKGAWYMLNYTVKYNADLVKRRFTGDYDTDEWGLDWEFLDAVRPFFTFLYKAYWRVETTGIENIPIDGRALLVPTIRARFRGMARWWARPFLNRTSRPTAGADPVCRLVRPGPFLFLMAGEDWAKPWPRWRTAPACWKQEELVAVFPEGYKGMGKLYKDRYRLARFGRGRFVRMAMNTGAHHPCVGGGLEETYIVLAKSTMMAAGPPAALFPITPTFPWLGLLGLVPLPTKWYIDFGQPIPTEPYGADAADNLVLVSQFTDQVRHVVQDMVDERLDRRRTVFF